MKFLAALVLAAPLWAQCTYTLDKTTVNLPAAATPTTTINVTTSDPACQWLPNVTAGTTWLHLPTASQQIVTGTGSFTFTADANPVGVARSGTITVLTVNNLSLFVTVTQDAAVCNVLFSPDSQTISAAGGGGAVVVTANCAWAVNNNVGGGWLVIPQGTPTGGITDQVVKFNVAANSCVASRSGTLTLSSGSLAKPLVATVSQLGSASNFSISATSATANATASDNRFTVTTGTGCGWTATSDVSWMQITAGSNGSGNGAIAYHLIANTSVARTGNIHVNAAPGVQFLYTVTQQSAGPPAPVISGVANAASYTSTAISPGEIVAVFGQNLGPATLTGLQVSNGAVTTTLAGTQVLFDGTPAPVIYTVKNQVSAVVPFSLVGKSSTQVQVSYNGALSDAFPMTVQNSTPGIFTIDSSGLGPGAILNQDYSLNSSSLPAAKGSVVSIYCTGGGAMSPGIADGTVVGSPLPQLTLPVTVTMGGVDAKVSYAGGAAGTVAGLVQINAQIPAGVTSGGKVPVVVTIGNVSSAAGVTIAVQ